MEGRTFLQSLRFTNLLSFGGEGTSIELGPLNVLIGPNASGKSNLLEAIGLLAATPRDILAPIREGGGVSEWLWKGAKSPPVAEIEATLPWKEKHKPLRYWLAFTAVGPRLEIVGEILEYARPGREDASHPYLFYEYLHGRPTINVRLRPDPQFDVEIDRPVRTLRREDVSPDQSILSQRKDPDQYPELTNVGTEFGKIHLYREWNLGRYTAPRLPQKADLPEDFLLEDASNLGLVLNDLQNRRDTRRLILDRLKLFYERAEDLTTKVQGGTVQIFLHEQGLATPVPATRLSDGTLRYLCLLTLLCHPSPPPLICIEEPELGLHPDALPILADLLRDAAQRTQMIVTTHSDALVSALSEVPESVVVCERGDAGTEFRRLEPEKLRGWLDRYKLGELWRMGELGGTRW